MIVPTTRTRIVVSIVALASALSVARCAQASTTTLTTIGQVSALSAGSGWVTWSERDTDRRWHLTAWHDGAKIRLPIPGRAAPFDADIGTNLADEPVVTYSRCSKESPRNTGTRFVPPNGLNQHVGEQGCRLYAFDLIRQTEAPIAVPRPSGASDTTPSMWKGNLAFARLLPKQKIATLHYLPAGAQRPRTLSPGSVVRRCLQPHRPKRGDCEADVQQMDLGASQVAFVWRQLSDRPETGITGNTWELRLGPLSGRTGKVIARGQVSWGFSYWPLSPSIRGRQLWYVMVTNEGFSPESETWRTEGGRKRRIAAAGQFVHQIAVDGDSLYRLEEPLDPDAEDYTCPCTLTSQPIAP